MDPEIVLCTTSRLQSYFPHYFLHDGYVIDSFFYYDTTPPCFRATTTKRLVVQALVRLKLVSIVRPNKPQSDVKKTFSMRAPVYFWFAPG